jgi:hypothetical protein
MNTVPRQLVSAALVAECAAELARSMRTAGEAGQLLGKIASRLERAALCVKKAKGKEKISQARELTAAIEKLDPVLRQGMTSAEELFTCVCKAGIQTENLRGICG